MQCVVSGNEVEGPTLLCVGDPNIQYNWGRQTREGRLELSRKFMSFGGATRPFVTWLVTCSFETSLKTDNMGHDEC